MPKDGAYYISAVSGGNCVTKTTNGLLDKYCDGSSAQHWTIEAGDEPNKVAFQNAENGEYLFVVQGYKWGKIDTSSTKQWWILEKGTSPGTCWIKCCDFKDIYLCNLNGSVNNNNTVHAWAREEPWRYSLEWHLVDANAPGFLPGASKSSTGGGDESKQSQDALAKKEQELRDREQKVAAEEAAQKKHADQLAYRERALVKEQPSTAQNGGSDSGKAADVQRKLDELRKKERDLAAKQAAADKKAQQAADKEADLARREAALRNHKSAGVGEIEKLKAEGERLRKELADARKSASTSTSNRPSPDAKEMAMLKRENQRLKDLAAEQALKLHDAQKQRPGAAAAANGTSAPNGKEPTATKPQPTNAAPLKPEDPDVAKLKAENAALEKEIRDAKNQPNGTASSKPTTGQASQNPSPAAVARPSSKPTGSKTDGGIPNGHTSNATAAAAGRPLGKPTGSKTDGGLPNGHTSNAAPAAAGRPSGKPTGSKTDGGAPNGHRPNANISRPLAKSPPSKETTAGNKPDTASSPTHKPGTNGVSKGQPSKPTPKPATGPASSSSPASELEQLKKENERLRKQREDLIKKQQSPSKEPPGHSNGMHGHGASKGQSRVEEEEDGVIEFECGHVLYAPPRKLEREVVGILYAQ